MTILERSIYVHAPYQAVDAIACEPLRLPEWFAGVEAVDTEPGPFESGKTARLTYRVNGLDLQVGVTMIECVPGEFALFRLDGMITGTLQWDIETEGRGTILYAIFDYDMPGHLFARLTDRLIAERINGEQLARSLHNLAMMVESKAMEQQEMGPEYYWG